MQLVVLQIGMQNAFLNGKKGDFVCAAAQFASVRANIHFVNFHSICIFYAVQHQFDIAGINKLARLCKPTFLLIILHLLLIILHLFFLTLILIILHLIILHLLLIILHLLPNATDDHPPLLGPGTQRKAILIQL